MRAHLMTPVWGMLVALWLAFPATADDRVFLLQLGSFESESEARARWIKLQDSYPELLQGLKMRLLDVSLPPDNFTVYRTQAGALESRADAEIICERLTGNGDECYVVETAMFNPAELAAAPQPIPQPVPQPIPQPIPQAVVQPVLQPVPQAIPQPLPQPVLQPIPAPVAQPVAVPNAPPPLLLTPEAGELQQEMQAMEAEMQRQAAFAQPTLPAGAGLEPADGESEESFWSWINPFSDDEPVRGVPQRRMDRIEFEGPALPQPPQLRGATIPESLIADAGDADLALRLPPPPVPSAGYVPPQVVQPLTPQARVATPLARQPALRAQAPANLPFQVKRNGQLVTPPPGAFVPAGDEVKVAEAVPVPLSTLPTAQAPLVALPRSTRPSAADLRRLGTPSQPAGDQRLWAELNYFRTQQDALAYWDEFRRLNPDFPAVRVRITNPYSNVGGGRPLVSLRVGPFEFVNQVQAICSGIDPEDMSCQAVRDLGASTTAGTVRASSDALRREQRYQRSAPSAAYSMYWVQLGGFSSPGAAEAAWRGLVAHHAPLLNDAAHNVASPQRSSALQAVYRLRTGPFAMRPQADQLCDLLKTQGSKCLTVFSQ